MCTRYISPDGAAIERIWHVGRSRPWQGAEVFPRAAGAFIRADRESSAAARELVVGPWGLIPWFAKEPRLSYSTQNARSEEVAAKASYKQPWARGQRCIIPAWSFDEPNWESGRNVWWRFGRADGMPWGLAGLWATWVDKGSGEVFESYTMLTVNADACPLMRRMHKPDPRLPADQQDKRAVVPIAPEDLDLWLHGTVREASSLIRFAPLEDYLAGPANAAGQGPKT
ncbi:MAG: SOS response-associated peptidase family protein [Rubrivivax sp.]|nr:SOS response-associated peptidase family protein [Rubrivivax sp.]